MNAVFYRTREMGLGAVKQEAESVLPSTLLLRTRPQELNFLVPD